MLEVSVPPAIIIHQDQNNTVKDKKGQEVTMVEMPAPTFTTDAVGCVDNAMKNKVGVQLDTNNILDPFVREKLFPGVVYLFKDDPRLLALNGPLFRKMREKITVENTNSQNQFMVGATESQWKLYLEHLYTEMIRNKIMAKIFNSKRSNIYGAMKYRFQSKCAHHNKLIVREYKSLTYRICNPSNSACKGMPKCICCNAIHRGIPAEKRVAQDSVFVLRILLQASTPR